jgi:hypothetical protein
MGAPPDAEGTEPLSRVDMIRRARKVKGSANLYLIPSTFYEAHTSRGLRLLSTYLPHVKSAPAHFTCPKPTCRVLSVYYNIILQTALIGKPCCLALE